MHQLLTDMPIAGATTECPTQLDKFVAFIEEAGDATEIEQHMTKTLTLCATWVRACKGVLGEAFNVECEEELMVWQQLMYVGLEVLIAKCQIQMFY